ncbi:MAG: hypothetical protein NC079_05215 [Clostridium sp.]|nr:hypothetical protein [Acetatifactor muris]MCM1526807.1 hypothetical protein [Bacteroides sp.]MCM1562992.1 hypothetical protein [Clostridium sp.]
MRRAFGAIVMAWALICLTGVGAAGMTTDGAERQESAGRQESAAGQESAGGQDSTGWQEVAGQQDSAAREGGAADRDTERRYREWEEELLSDTKILLTAGGFRNSGVTLNRIVDAEGHRTYTFTIHHRHIDRMTEEERQSLAGELGALTEGFGAEDPDGSCEFLYDFLIL